MVLVQVDRHAFTLLSVDREKNITKRGDRSALRPSDPFHTRRMCSHALRHPLEWESTTKSKRRGTLWGAELQGMPCG